MTTATAPRRRRRGLTIVVVAVALVAAGFGARLWLTKAEGDPQAVEFADATLSPELTNATVLGLGEANHGTAELQRLRLALIQKLPNTRAIMIEEDFGSTAQVNDFIAGGDGTAQDAARRFGFVVSQTNQMVELLQWLRDTNAGRQPAERIQLVGIDSQRVDANKEIALGWLGEHDKAEADRLRSRLTEWSDETRRTGDPAAVSERVRPVVEQLKKAIADTPNRPGRQRASNAVTTLQQHLALNTAGNGYSRTRAQFMADNVARTVTEQRERGNDHSLLFGHNGHLDKSSAAFTHRDTGGLLADRFGERYRVIGTELVQGRLQTGQGSQRWEVGIDNPTPLRGLFAGTSQGFLDFAAVSHRNAQLLRRPVRMSSAGEDFQQWQAWLPWLNSVEMIPAAGYDALIMVGRGTPTTLV